MVPMDTNKIMNWCEQPRIGEYVQGENDHTRRLIIVTVWLCLLNTDSAIVQLARAQTARD